ncbi:lysozyme [Xanthobacter sp. ZOL 2024]
MAHRDTNAAGIDLIKSFESFVPFVYDDLRPTKGKYGYAEWEGGTPKGTLTIGYGHTNSAKHPLKIKKGLRVSEAEALDILNVDLDDCEDRVSRAVKVPISDNQFAALVSFDFNTGAIFSASFVKKLNAGDYSAAPAGMMLYTKSKGQTLRGLVRRRQAEVDLWKKADAKAAGDDDAPEPAGNVIPEAPVEDEPLRKSGVMQGSATAAGGGAIMLAASADDLARKLDEADGHFSAGSAIGVAIGALILIGALYAIYSRMKAADKLPSWLGGAAA